MSEALRVFAVCLAIMFCVGSCTYIIVRDEQGKDDLAIACVNSGGEWSSTWGGECSRSQQK